MTIKLALIGLFFALLTGLFGAAIIEIGGSNAVMALARVIGVSPSAAQASAAGLVPAEGYRVELYADGLDGPRLMVQAPNGDIIVSERKAGRITRLSPDSDGDGRSDASAPLIDGLSAPHGLAFVEGNQALLIAEEGALRRVAYDPQTGTTDGPLETVVSGLPTDGGHSTRTVGVGPDGMIYLSVGSSCNVCIEDNPWRATILRMRADGSAPEVFASGLRNTVGFDWRPATGDLYGVDNGRDRLGDDFPPDELNLIVAGGFYGWPFYNGANVADPDLGADAAAPRGEQIAPVHGLGPHVAPLAIRFLEHQSGPAMNGAALVTLHGSWNRSERIGYQVDLLTFERDGTIAQQPFLTGFRSGETVHGRPVDVIETGEGTIFVSDDYAGAIYRVTPAN